MSDTAMSTGYMTPQELKEQERAAKKAERARLKRVEMDEKAERRRAAKSGFANVSNPRRSKLLTIVCALFAVYCLFPFVYLLVNATKTQADFTSTFGLGFGHTFALWDNIVTVFTYQDGIFGRWLLNTLLYVVVGGRRDTAGHHGRLRAGEVPFPGPQGRVRGHHRRDQRAGHRVGGPAVPAVRQAQPDEHAVGHDHSIVDQPVWFVSDVDLLRAGGSTELLEAARVDGASESERSSRCPCRCWLRASLRRPCSRSWRRGTTTSCR